MKEKWTVEKETKSSGHTGSVGHSAPLLLLLASLRTQRASWSEHDTLLFAHVSTAEHFPQHRLCGGDAADHGQQVCPEEAKRCRATSAAGSRLPRLQLPAAAGECQLMVVSQSIKNTDFFVCFFKDMLRY